MSTPLYQRIAASLRERILSGGHPAGDTLPSENELAGAYRTSRTTVRRAFQILESEGLIKPRQGKGYIVQTPRRAVFTLVFKDGGETGKYRYQGVDIRQPDGEATRLLGLHDGQLVVAVRRVLERDGIPVAFDEKFIPYERGVPSVELELHFSEFPDLFTDLSDAASLHTEMFIQAETPPAEIAAALRSGDEKLLTITRLVCTFEGQRAGLGRTYFTPAFGPLRADSGGSPTG